MTATYTFPTPVISGEGALSFLPSIVESKGLSQTVIVTDSTIVNLAWFSQLTAHLSATVDVTVFSDFHGPPRYKNVEDGAAFLRSIGAESVIAIGGGSVMDLAKAMVLMQHYDGHLFDYEVSKSGTPPVTSGVADLIAIPTTAGTGSEVSRIAVISDDESRVKKILSAPTMLPTQVIADPELTLGLPASLSASIGFNALTHLLEAFLARGDHPMCDGIALEGLRLIALNLASTFQMAQAHELGRIFGHAEAQRYIDAGDGMLNASIMGTVAAEKGLGVTHSCAHALATVNHIHHGLANAIMLVPCMRYNAEVVPERFVRVARSMALSTPTSEGFFVWLENLFKETRLPRNLSEIGVQATDIPALVEVAMGTGSHRSGPRAVNKAQFIILFEEALNQ